MTSLARLSFTTRPYVWGGTRLIELFGLSSMAPPLAEVWACSALKPDPSVFVEGPYAGQTLSAVYASHPEIFGHPRSSEFPLLFKFLDANQALSVQVHPDDAYASAHALGRGKNEAWVILEAQADAKIILGHRYRSKEQFISALEDHSFEQGLQHFCVEAGDMVSIPARRVHALGAGLLVYEVQQSSDNTFRIYDYDRVDANGQPRRLQLDQALDLIAFPEPTDSKALIHQQRSRSNGASLSTQNFELSLYQIEGHQTIALQGFYNVVACLKGTARINQTPFELGTHALAFHACRSLHVEGNCTLAITQPKE